MLAYIDYFFNAVFILEMILKVSPCPCPCTLEGVTLPLPMSLPLPFPCPCFYASPGPELNLHPRRTLTLSLNPNPNPSPCHVGGVKRLCVGPASLPAGEKLSPNLDSVSVSSNFPTRVRNSNQRSRLT